MSVGVYLPLWKFLAVFFFFFFFKSCLSRVLADPSSNSGTWIPGLRHMLACLFLPCGLARRKDWVYREMSGWTRKESLTMSPDCGVLGVLWDTGTPKKLWDSEVRGRHAKTSSEHKGFPLGLQRKLGWVCSRRYGQVLSMSQFLVVERKASSLMVGLAWSWAVLSPLVSIHSESPHCSSPNRHSKGSSVGWFLWLAGAKNPLVTASYSSYLPKVFTLL